jgi:hypothetical protein
VEDAARQDDVDDDVRQVGSRPCREKPFFRDKKSDGREQDDFELYLYDLNHRLL